MQKKQKLNRYIIYSLLFHVLILAALVLTNKLQNDTHKNEALEVALLSPEEVKALLQAPDAKTIVETDSQTANQKLNETAKFLSEKSNSVEKETRAKFGAEFKNRKTFENKTQAAKSEKKSQPAQKSASEKPDLFKNDFDPYAALEKKSAAREIKNTADNRKPNAAGSASEASSTNDNLKNIESEFLTRLNTKEYKYFGYYNRIKTQLNQWWVPQVQQRFSKMVKQGRSIASEESKITKLVIVLSNSGQLVKVQVLAESGIRDLDEAAIEAFRQAAPFPNPPKGMIDSDGTVKIRWDCVVES